MKIKFAILLVALLFVVPFAAVLAQGPTEEPTAEATAFVPEEVEVTEGETETIPTPNEETEIVVTTETENVTYYGMIIAFGAAIFGVLLGGGGVFAILSRANKSVEVKDSTEKLLAEGVPQAYLDNAHQVTMAMLSHVDTAVQGLKDALQFVASITDGQPNVPPAQG